jgi:endonuclease YncB( thermonuclease family)
MFSRNRKRRQKLQLVEYKDVPFFSFDGYKTWAKVVKVYDGDTCTVAFYYHKKIYKFKIRLANIDTPELRSENKTEVEIANKARDRLIELINNELVYIECLNYDKYGRMLANIYANKKMSQSFNDKLVSEGLAVFYDGGKKQDFETWYKNVKVLKFK